MLAVVAAVGRSAQPLELRSGQTFAEPETSAGGSHCPVLLHYRLQINFTVLYTFIMYLLTFRERTPP